MAESAASNHRSNAPRVVFRVIRATTWVANRRRSTRVSALHLHASNAAFARPFRIFFATFAAALLSRFASRLASVHRAKDAWSLRRRSLATHFATVASSAFWRSRLARASSFAVFSASKAARFASADASTLKRHVANAAARVRPASFATLRRTNAVWRRLSSVRDAHARNAPCAATRRIRASTRRFVAAAFEAACFHRRNVCFSLRFALARPRSAATRPRTPSRAASVAAASRQVLNASRLRMRNARFAATLATARAFRVTA